MDKICHNEETGCLREITIHRSRTLPHNPYWAKRYFAADWKQWNVDRVFIQAYNEKNFKEELIYAQKYDGIAITDNQLGRLTTIINDPKIKSVMIFPLVGQPEKTASKIQTFVQNN